MENNLKAMDNLYQEIQNKDEEINKLKKLMELMNIKQKKRNRDIKKRKYKYKR